jgi:16S rRNA (adenine1518-N6/adenine1519-N6)-dimethyltransferase
VTPPIETIFASGALIVKGYRQCDKTTVFCAILGIVRVCAVNLLKKEPFVAKRPKNHHLESPRKKKTLGQHFLRDFGVLESMISRVCVSPEINVLEIGCGDGFLTSAILEKTPCKRLICFEIDPEWHEFVRHKISDEHLDLRLKNILDQNWDEFSSFQPLVMLANLPYQITFPIMFRIQQHRHLFQEGVVMVQEEVAQKIMATGGRNYGHTSLFLQHFFSFELMDKIAPEAFSPPPKVYSRLLYFRPRQDVPKISREGDFWRFVSCCFASPRRTLKNNLLAAKFETSNLPDDILSLRAQQMSFEDFVLVWEMVG